MTFKPPGRAQGPFPHQQPRKARNASFCLFFLIAEIDPSQDLGTVALWAQADFAWSGTCPTNKLDDLDENSDTHDLRPMSGAGASGGPYALPVWAGPYTSQKEYDAWRDECDMVAALNFAHECACESDADLDEAIRLSLSPTDQVADDEALARQLMEQEEVADDEALARQLMEQEEEDEAFVRGLAASLE